MEAICQVCMHHCRLKEGQWGICRARRNEKGEVVSKTYGLISSLALDPIEKKPLNRFYPGSMILSVGSLGCNLRCPFCQNYEISMTGPQGTEDSQAAAGTQGMTGSRNAENAQGTKAIHDEEGTEIFISPEELTGEALQCSSMGNIGVAFTYNEPLVGYEYVLDTAKLVREAGMKTVLVTNGTAEPWVIEKLLPYTDAMNIDLKGFTEEYYRKLGGSLEVVKEVIKMAVGNCHVELTTLVVPGENDSALQMEEQARWIAELGEEIPLHVTRFFPRYQMRDRRATDVGKVYELADVARRYLKYVYVGNC